MRPGRFALRSTLVLALLAGGDWLLGRVVLADGWFLGRPVAPFDPPLFSPSQLRVLEQIEQDLASAQPTRAGRFDPELGWCNKPESGFGDFRYDWAGARIGVAPLARVKAAGIRRVVAVGCSMTHGEEVGATESWCARVDELLPGVEIANLGVAAYGLDQALLRLRRDGWPLEPDEVWLGVLPQAALRVTTRFRPLLDHWSLDVAFKPRFVLEAGGLVLVPNPVASLIDVPRLLHDQRAFLAALGDDPWIERARLAYAPQGSSWTQLSFAARVLTTVWERGGRELEACFDTEQEFGRLYSAIVRTMARECAERGLGFRLILLPGEEDLRARARAGRGYWEGWAEGLRSEGLHVLDLAPALAREDGERAPLFGPGGHYSRAASELVARELVVRISE